MIANPVTLYRLFFQNIPTEAQMPWAYSRSNPKGRYLSDDLGLVGHLAWLQPWQWIPRRWRARRLPLPLKQTSGKGRKERTLWDPSYPSSPDADIAVLPYTWEIGGKRVTADFAQCLLDVAEDDGFASFAAFLDGKWRNVYWRFFKRIPRTNKTFKWSFGFIRADTTVSPPETRNGKIKSDCLCWIFEWGCTLAT